MNCGVEHRGGLDLMLLWLWYRPSAAALIRPLAGELTYAAGVTLKKKKKKKKGAYAWVYNTHIFLNCLLGGCNTVTYKKYVFAIQMTKMHVSDNK